MGKIIYVQQSKTKSNCNSKWNDEFCSEDKYRVLELYKKCKVDHKYLIYRFLKRTIIEEVVTNG